MGNGVWLDGEGREGLMRIRGIGGGKLDGLDPCAGYSISNVVTLLHCIYINLCIGDRSDGHVHLRIVDRLFSHT